MGGGNWSVRGVGVGGFAEPDGVNRLRQLRHGGYGLIMGFDGNIPSRNLTRRRQPEGSPHGGVGPEALALFGNATVAERRRFARHRWGAATRCLYVTLFPVPVGRQGKSAVVLRA